MSDIGIRVATEGAATAAGELDKVGDALERVQAQAEKLKDERAENAFYDAGKGAKEASSEVEGLGDSFLNLKSAIAAAGLLEAAKQVWGLVQAGDQLSDVMSQLGDTSIETARDVTQGLIPSLDLAQSRGQLLAAGLSVTDREMAAIAAGAQVFALRTGTEGSAALSQLTGALVTGNQRGLRPFNIALQEGQSGANGTREALLQLSGALDANSQNIARNTGNVDRLGAAYDTAKEKLGIWFNLMAGGVEMVNDLGTTVEQFARALAGGPQSLTDALNQAFERSDSWIRQMPLFSSELLSGAQAARQLARDILNIPPPPAFVGEWRETGLMRSTMRRGGAMLAPGEANYTGAPRNRAEWARRQYGNDADGRALARAQDQAITDALSAPDSGGGGGGGGGGGNAASDGLSAVQRSLGEIARILREAQERADANADALVAAMQSERQGGGLFGISDEADLAARGGRGVAAGTNDRRYGSQIGGRDPLTGRNNTQTLSGFARATDAATKYGGALSALEASGTMALGALTSAVESNVAAWVAGEQSIGAALAGILKQTLATIATQSIVKALESTALGLFLVATSMGMNPAAEAAFAAAGTYAAVAALAGGGAMAMSAASSSGSSHRSGSGSSARSNGGAVRDSGGGGNTVIHNYVLSQGSTVITESPRQFSEHIQRAGRSNARRRGQRVPVPAM